MHAAPNSLPGNPRFAFELLPERFDAGTITPTAFAQDGPGFLWIGTQQGLLRYDGGRIRHYGRQDGLPTLFIDQIELGSSGRIWLGTNDGVARYDGDRFEMVRIPVPGARFDSTYQIIATDNLDGVYIGTSAGLLRLDQRDPSKYRLWNHTDGLPGDSVEALFYAADNVLYFICGGRIAILRTPAAAPEILTPTLRLERGERYIAIVVDADKVVWVRTNYHVARLDPGSTKFVQDDEGIPKANDFGIPVLDRSGHLMLPTVRGLFRRVNGRWECTSERQGMISDAVFAAMEDREGAIWVGYGGSGVARWPESRNWSAWTKAEGLPDNVVWAEIRDLKGRLWVGTDNGLAMWDAPGRRWRIWTEKDGLAGATVRELTVGNDGTIWALSIPGGLSRVDPETLRIVATPMPEDAGNALGAAVAPDGRIWVGNSRCLKILSIRGGKPVYENVDLPLAAVGTTSHPTFAVDGTFWSSGRKGVSRFDGRKWTTFTKAQGLRADVVSTVMPVSGTEAWIRYVEPLGLGHLELTSSGGVKVTHVTTADGMASDAVFMLGRDHTGRIWAGGNKGVNVIEPTGRIHTLTRADGLIWNDLSAEGFWADHDGSVYLGTSRGLVRFRAGDIDFKVVHPEVIITAASVGGKEQLRHRQPNERDPITPNARRTFSAQFAELSFRDPEKTPCRYRMGGLESEYTETLQREVRYVSLPSGSYRFEVGCQYADGTWSAPATFAFAVAPAWWERWWTRLTGLCLLAFAILAAVRLRTRALENDRRRLEEAVAARSDELARANRELEEAALTDPLTKARNRRFLQLTIDTDVQASARSYFDPHCGDEPRDLIFYLVDLDHFKRVNDELGHQAGDYVLSMIAERLQQVIRSSDTLIRWGGEEFMIVSRDARRQDAEVLARRILDVIGCEPLELSDGGRLRCTCSIGWTAFPWLTSEPLAHSSSDVVQFADRALYMAKHAGRNQSIGLAPMDACTSEELRTIRTAGPEVEASVAIIQATCEDLTTVPSMTVN